MSSGRAGHIWRVPIGLALLTLFGLLSALIGEGGLWWWLSWGALAMPIVVIVYHVGRAHRGMQGRP